MDYRFGKNHQLNDYITTLAWSANATKLIAGLSEGEVVVVDILKDTIINRWKTNDNGTLKVGFLDNETVVSAGQDGLLKIWTINDNQLLTAQKTGGAWVENLAISHKKQLIATGSGKFLKIWSFVGALLHESTHKSTISHIEFAKDGQELAVVYYGGASIYDISNWQEMAFSYQSSFISGALSQNKRFLAAGTQDQKIHFWLLPYQPESDLEMSGYPLKVKTLSWSENSLYLATPSIDSIIIWNTTSGSPQGQQPDQLPGHKGRVTQVAFQPNGFLLASADERGKMLIWGYPLLKEHFFDRQMKTKEITNLVWAEKEFLLAFSTAEGLLQFLELQPTPQEKMAFAQKMYVNR